ncbi:MAG: DNA translocase FtsK 4TM domain-containing protein [Minisyncoccia bacterium]
MEKKEKEKEKKQKIEEKTQESVIGLEIKNSILAIVFLAIAIILVLSAFNLAGPLGIFFYKIFNYLLGWGYFLLPLLLIFLALILLEIHEDPLSFNTITLIGFLLILFSSLTILNIFSPHNGGFLGEIGSLLVNYLGKLATIIFYLSVLISGIILIFNKPLHLANIFKKKEKEKKFVINEEQEEIKKEEESRETPTPSPIKGTFEETNSKIKDKNLFEGVNKKKIPLTYKLKDNYVLPPLDLLESTSSKPSVGDLKANANIIKRTLESFGIIVEMGEINVGPTVTQYTLKPTEGVKLSSITALQNDLALALAAHPLRIEAPIPGKSLVGIEVPNKSVALVRLGSLLKEIDFQKDPAFLTMVLGRDVEGKVIVADLSKMPHLLIAGATGSGKSVCIHSIISTFLFKNSPNTLRLILIDPKRVELARYNGIPHLLTSVITDNKKVLPALRWIVEEMGKRYDLLSQYQARDIESYNNKALAHNENILPYIVIIIDELADLMMYYGRDLETFIIRIAQMARATGIHLILSTQRPSVEVITGLIKANITARIAFQVASQVDSRTILDMAGAEKLLGHGDMLFLSPETSKPKRIQGAYLSEGEIDRLVDFIIKNSKLLEQNNLSSDLDEYLNESATLQMNIKESEEDELYPEAYEVVIKAQKASASFLQRRLKIGYARAARLLDMLEARGVIGPQDGAKPREVYVKNENESS